MNELSNQMRQERFYITDSVSRVNATLDMYADKVELMEAVIFEHNKLLDALNQKLDDKTKQFRAFREARIGHDYITHSEELETKIEAAHYQIKRAIAQLSEPLIKTPIDHVEVKLTVMSVVAQLTMYIEGD